MVLFDDHLFDQVLHFRRATKCFNPAQVSFIFYRRLHLIGPAEEQRLTVVAKRVQDDTETPRIGLARVLAEVVDLGGGIALRSHLGAHIHIRVLDLTAGAEITKFDPDASIIVRHDKNVAELHISVVDLPLVAMVQCNNQLRQDFYNLLFREDINARVGCFSASHVLAQVAHCAN